MKAGRAVWHVVLQDEGLVPVPGTYSAVDSAKVVKELQHVPQHRTRPMETG